MTVVTLEVLSDLADFAGMRGVLLGGVVAGVLLLGPLPVPGSPAAAASAVPGAGAASWDRPRGSIGADPEDVVRTAPARGPVRVVTLRSVDGRPRVTVRAVTGRAAAEQAVAAAQDRAGAVAVAVDTPVSALESSARATASWNDAYRDLQWGLTRLRAEDTRSRRPATGVTVAVVDSGVDASHPDLAGAVLPGTDLVTGAGDGTADGDGHGTHVAGIVAATADDGAGVAGFAPDARILPVRVLDDTGSGYDSDVAEGIIWAVDHGASVVNLSLGGPTPTDVTAAAVSYALSRGAVVVAAAGNERTEGNPVTYPAAYAGVIGVAASASDDTVAPFSNTGSYVDVTAPGVRIASTYPLDRYVYLSGTSMAAPFVAASAAVLRSADPALSPARVTELLQSTATDLGPAGRDDAWGHGLVDPLAALCEVQDCAMAAPPAPTVSPTPTPAVTEEPASPAPPPTAQPAPVVVTQPAPPFPTTIVVSRQSARVLHGSRVEGWLRLVDATTGSGVGGAALSLCVRTAPAAQATCTDRTTDGSGMVLYSFTARGNTTVSATHAGSALTAASASPALTYRVAPRVRLTTGPRSLAARVAPAQAPTVALQRWTGKRWARVATDKVSRKGTVAFEDLRAGRYRLRVAASATTAAATKGGIRVRG